MFINPKQLEPILTDRIRSLYHLQIGHRPEPITCNFLRNSQLAIVLEDSVTPIERLLLSNGYPKLAKSVRNSVEAIVRPHLIDIIEEVTQANVIDFLINSKLETGRMSIIIILEPRQDAMSNKPRHQQHPQVHKNDVQVPTSDRLV